MPRCLVTGGAGFVGSNLVDALIEQGNRVVIIDDLSTGKKEYLNKRAKFYQADICDSKKVREIFKKESASGRIDFVYHLAAQIDLRISVANPQLDNKINVLGGINVLENSRLFKAGKFIFASTGGAIYGDEKKLPTPESFSPRPFAPYGIHKLTFEKYLYYYHTVYGLDYTILRFANIYGPRQYKGGEAGVISIFIDNAVNEQVLKINGRGRQTRDYVYIDDVVKAFLQAARIKYADSLNISTAKETDLLEIIKFIEKAMGKKLPKKFGPAKLGEQKRSALDNNLARKILKWQPKISIEDGIKKTVEWSLKENKKG